MRVGVIGLGKLGLPVAYCMASRGLDVYGFDPQVGGPPEDCSHEAGLAELVDQHSITYAPIGEVVAKCDCIFVAVQTPHEPEYEGITRIPETRVDFDYSYLRKAVVELSAAAWAQKRKIVLSVISTVLPGTMAREVRPLLTPTVGLAYSPSFIAMGTTIQDFLNPEFVLLGGNTEPRKAVANVFRQMRIGPLREVSTESAELIKVAYNTFIGLKIAFANTLLEVCHKTEGTDVDEVTNALALAKRRLISPAYMAGGMGDGGGCHPRDNIALSWLARELDLSYDLFESAMECRERQAEWLADLMCEYDLPKAMLGLAYKADSHLMTGSPAVLVRNILKERNVPCLAHDPHIYPNRRGGVGFTIKDPHVFLVGCNHSTWPIDLPEGSVVIDPWRLWPDQDGIEVIRLGEGIRSASNHRAA